MAIAKEWLAGIYIDAELDSVRDDDSRTWEIRALAGASVGVPPLQGFLAVAELSAAARRIVRGEAEGKLRLARILERGGGDYQRCLWYMVAGRDPVLAASCLGELERLMQARCALWAKARRAGLGPVKAADPYATAARKGRGGTSARGVAAGPFR